MAFSRKGGGMGKGTSYTEIDYRPDQEAEASFFMPLFGKMKILGLFST